MMGEFLKCDAEGCNHEETVSEINEALIGKPCPDCGASLLTPADYEFWIKQVKPMQEMLLALGLALEVDHGEIAEGEASMLVGYHDGELTVKTQVK